MSKLQNLNLYGNTIGDEGVRAFIGAILTSKTLETLDVGSNGISKDGACALAGALASNPSLTKLGMRGNCIGDAGAVAFSKCLRGSCNTRLLSLDLRDNGIGVEGVRALQSSLQVNSRILALLINPKLPRGLRGGGQEYGAAIQSIERNLTRNNSRRAAWPWLCVQQRLAWCCGGSHSRLGRDSACYCLPDDLVDKIGTAVLARFPLRTSRTLDEQAVVAVPQGMGQTQSPPNPATGGRHLGAPPPLPPPLPPREYWALIDQLVACEDQGDRVTAAGGRRKQEWAFILPPMPASGTSSFTSAEPEPEQPSSASSTSACAAAAASSSSSTGGASATTSTRPTLSIISRLRTAVEALLVLGHSLGIPWAVQEQMWVVLLSVGLVLFCRWAF